MRQDFCQIIQPSVEIEHEQAEIWICQSECFSSHTLHMDHMNTITYRWPVLGIFSDHEHLASFLTPLIFFNKLLALLCSDCHRFLKEDVFAGFQTPHGRIIVQIMWQHNVDSIKHAPLKSIIQAGEHLKKTCGKCPFLLLCSEN